MHRCLRTGSLARYRRAGANSKNQSDAPKLYKSNVARSAAGLLLLSGVFASSCSPASPATPTGIPYTATASRTATPTRTPSPTIPPTFTLVPTAASTPLPTPGAVFKSVPMSAADQQAYEEALKDIDTYRKGDLTLHLQGTDGNPLAGYQVQYQQLDHEFWFGTSTAPFNADLVVGAGLNGVTILPQWWLTEPEDGKYKLEFADFWFGAGEFTSVGLRLKTNDMFTPGYEGSYMKGLPFDQYLQKLEEHVTAIVRRFGPEVEQWEAVLEPNFGNNNPYGWSHDRYMQAIATSIRAIRENDPGSKVEINLSYPCGGIEWLNNFAIVDELLKQGIDFDVLGLQLYYNAYILGPPAYSMDRLSLASMSRCVDRYEQMLIPYDKTIQGSEISVPADAPPGVPGYWGHPWSEDLQAQYLKTAYTIMFAKPINHGLTWWDFQSDPPDGFVYQGGLIDSEQKLRKSYWTLKHLIETWTTSGTGFTDGEGELVIDGFGGTYKLVIRDPATGAEMRAEAHISEQTTQEMTVSFAPQDILGEMRDPLTRLTDYWRRQGDDTRWRIGSDDLARAAYHETRGEIEQAQQALLAGLKDLSLERTWEIKPKDYSGVSYETSVIPRLNGGWAVIWSGDVLYHRQNFPAGHAKVSLVAYGRPVNGVYPTMVIGIGGHFSKPLLVDHSGEYSAEFDLDGSENVFTVRFLYEENPNPGEFKLLVDEATITEVSQDTR